MPGPYVSHHQSAKDRLSHPNVQKRSSSNITFYSSPTIMSFITRAVRPTAARLSGAVRVNAGVTSVAVSRGKHTLPDLPYDYAELEPAISGRIMEV